ncbi:HNH endonuclease signature motif containing protein [Candidatus Poriferisodalis sp.]|uniref:HNH endonuclease signature motif containing protein n=1 Tax=Candidatus Poriferisodalis sp. TaxID=3101277 RepID=UPI003B51693F
MTARRSHHIIEWQDDGPTDYGNLVSVCNRCHDKIHQEGFAVKHNPNTGRFRLQPPTRPPP